MRVVRGLTCNACNAKGQMLVSNFMKDLWGAVSLDYCLETSCRGLPALFHCSLITLPLRGDCKRSLGCLLLFLVYLIRADNSCSDIYLF